MAAFYDPRIAVSDSYFQLSEEESRHCCRVLRLKENDYLELLDGKGHTFTCLIEVADPKRCKIKIRSVEEEEAPNYDMHLAIAPTKNIDRMEWFVEKATEIGVTEITFLSCSNSERTKLNTDRLERMVVAAMKQSKRTYLPKLNPLQSFKSFVKLWPNGLIAYCGEADKLPLEQVFTPRNCPILIGPEGDFTSIEVQGAQENGYKVITLGKNRLRTETAAMVACVDVARLVSILK
jgi:16S rRNA (uracil1498-N3)-methyltransferase